MEARRSLFFLAAAVIVTGRIATGVEAIASLLSEVSPTFEQVEKPPQLS